MKCHAQFTQQIYTCLHICIPCEKTEYKHKFSKISNSWQIYKNHLKSFQLLWTLCSIKWYSWTDWYPSLSTIIDSSILCVLAVSNHLSWLVQRDRCDYEWYICTTQLLTVFMYLSHADNTDWLDLSIKHHHHHHHHHSVLFITNNTVIHSQTKVAWSPGRL